MLALFCLIGAVWLFHIYGRTLPTAAVLAVWAGFTAMLTTALLRRARVRRAAFLSAYLTSTSPIAGHLRGGFLMTARAALLGAVLAALLAIALLRRDEPATWLALLCSVPAVVAVHAIVTRVLARHVSRVYLPELAWRITLAAVGAALIAAYAAIAFRSAYPALEGVSLERAVWHLVDQEHARSTSTQVLLQMAAAKDALRLWLAQQLMPVPGSSLAQAFGWLLVFAEEAVFVWSYLLLCGAVLIRTRGAGSGAGPLDAPQGGT